MSLPAVVLIELTPDVVADVAAGDAVFVARHGVRLGEHVAFVRDVVAQSEAHRARTGAPAVWGGYLTADPAAGAVVGVCAFVGAPSPEGEVEIAYGTIDAFQGRGYAAASARALIDIARRSSAVRTVIAHTLPVPNASGRLLQRLGFVRDGTAEDPDEGTVWRWVLPLGDETAPTR
ncbi:MAG TPA: GNAT family protein [Gemmatimonadaceae bacterium]|nr:GNAT family protein [Gemmatimonadaceae bacterium]